MSDTSGQQFRLPAIGFGTMRQQGSECQSLVEAALAEGYRHIDTARKYGNEAAVGAGIRRSSVPRDEILVATKIWIDELEPADVRTATLESLSRLRLDYVDLLVIHWPNRAVPVGATLEAMRELKHEGKTRSLGVANFPSALLAEVAATPDLIGDQVEYHPYLGQDAVLSVLRDHNLVLTAYCPLGRGGPLLEDKTLVEIAQECGRLVPQVILRWLIQQEGVVAIPGTSSVEHLRENFAVYDFVLDDRQMERVSSLACGDRVVNPPHAPVWD